LAGLYKALPYDTPDDVLLNEAIPSFRQLMGSPLLAEHLGAAVRGQHNGSINAHITLNAMMMGGEYQLDEVSGRELIYNWINNVDFTEYDDGELGMKFLTEVIAEIVD
jgi:hypothetical protein